MVIVCGIYKVTSPTKRIYIGQSIDIYKRWEWYKKLRCHHQKKLYNSFIKYGVEAHFFEIIEICDRISLNEKEAYYVELFNSCDYKTGLNLKSGGGSNVVFSEESRRRMSEAQKGKTFSAERNKKISDKLKGRFVGEKHPMFGKHHKADAIVKIIAAHKGRIKSDKEREAIRIKQTGRRHNDISKEKMRQKKLGIKLSEEIRIKIGNSLRGIKRSPEVVARVSFAQIGYKSACAKKVIQYCKGTNVIVKIWDCTMDVQRAMGIKNSNLSFVCTGKSISVGGYEWAYLGDILSGKTIRNHSFDALSEKDKTLLTSKYTDYGELLSLEKYEFENPDEVNEINELP